MTYADLDNYITILEASTGYGYLGVHHSLGFDYPFTSGRVWLTDNQQCTYPISAHAPSTIKIVTRESLRIAGATHITFFSPTPATFWINYHHIGVLTQPGERTPWIRIPPGEYTLRININNTDWAHTLWLVDVDTAPVNRLAIVTIGCFLEDELATRLKWLYQSAAQQGLLVHVYGVNEGLGNWFSRKIEGLAEFIGTLPSCYHWIMYLDGVDTFVLAREEELVDSLRNYGTVVIGAEACPWPCDREEFVNKFTAPTLHRFPQAGIWGGPREGVLRTLWQLQTLHYDLKTGRGPEWCYDNGYPIANIWDDQWLWQVCHLLHPHTYFRPDYYWEVTANLTCTNINPFNREVFTVEGGRLVTHWNTKPTCIHVSGSRKELCAQWYATLLK